MNVPFETTPVQRVRLLTICSAMREAGLDAVFVDLVSQYGWWDQGVYDLADAWHGEESSMCRSMCIELLRQRVRKHWWWRNA